jgi:hypothetical protein
MERLLDYEFEWVLPVMAAFITTAAANMRTRLERCIDWMKTR